MGSLSQLAASPPGEVQNWPMGPNLAELTTPTPHVPLPAIAHPSNHCNPYQARQAYVTRECPPDFSPHLRPVQRLAGPLEQKEHHRCQLRQEGHQLVAEVLHEVCHTVQQPHPLPRRQLLQALTVDVLQPPAPWAVPQLGSPPGFRKQPAGSATSCLLPGSGL